MSATQPADTHDLISVKGACVNNLCDVSVDHPKRCSPMLRRSLVSALRRTWVVARVTRPAHGDL